MDMDLLAEKHYPLSPYICFLNNPIFLDPDGNKVIIYYGQETNIAIVNKQMPQIDKQIRRGIR